MQGKPGFSLVFIITIFEKHVKTVLCHRFVLWETLQNTGVISGEKCRNMKSNTNMVTMSGF